MHDSLLYRFRGALLGAWLGEQIENLALARSWSADNPRSTEGDHLSKPCLMQPLLTQTTVLPQTGFSPNQQEFDGALSSMKAIVLTLPIALFYHDQPQILQQQLQQIFPATQQTESALAIVLGQTLSLILREQLRPDCWLESILQWVDGVADRRLVTQFQQVQHWIEVPTSLGNVTQGSIQYESIQHELNSADLTWPILHALYSFLSTSNNFAITLQRLQQLPTFTPISGLIAGLLSGAYNGVTGIPWHWRQQAGASFQAEPSLPENLVTEAELFQTADRLFAVWSGADHAANWKHQQLYTNMITAPRVIRFR